VSLNTGVLPLAPLQRGSYGRSVVHRPKLGAIVIRYAKPLLYALALDHNLCNPTARPLGRLAIPETDTSATAAYTLPVRVFASRKP
jgi:hypothetical protein